MTIFIDSFLPVEHIKGKRQENDLLIELLGFDFDLVINPTVFSELMFKFLIYSWRKVRVSSKKR